MVLIMFLTFSLLLVLLDPVKGSKTEDLKKEQETAWQELLGNEKTATRALLKFSTKPKESIAFFKSKMVALKIDEAEVKKLITDLGSEDKKVWQAAYEKLEYFDPRLAMSLQQAFDQSNAGVERGRLVCVLCDVVLRNVDESPLSDGNATLSNVGQDWFNFRVKGSSWGAEPLVDQLGARSYKKQWTRLVRVIILLEHFATDDAVAILKTMSTGHEKALPTTTAKEALKKLLVASEPSGK
jgi:hypothetical protein